MMPPTLTERVRDWICQDLAQVTGLSEPPLEALLIREGYFCGRRFSLGEHQAVWFIEENQIKLFGPEGQVIKSLVASELAEDVAPAEGPAEMPVDMPAQAEQKKAA